MTSVSFPSLPSFTPPTSPQEVAVATQALSALSKAGGFAGMLPASTKVMKSPMSYQPTPFPSPMTPPMPNMEARPVALIQGAVSGTAVVAMPTETKTPPSPSPSPSPLLLPASATRPPSPLPLPLPSATRPPSPLPLPSATRPPSPLPLPLPSATRPPSPSPLPSATRPPSPLPLPSATRHPSPLPGSVARPPSPLPLPLPSATRPPSPLPLPGSVARPPSPLPLPGSVARPPSPLPLPGSVARPPSPLPASPKSKSPSKISPLPPPDRKFETMSQAITETSIDNMLISKGYVRIETVTLDSDTQKLYIKAINPVGDVVFIQVDRSAGLIVQLDGHKVAKVVEGKATTESIKTTAKVCASSASCGTAFQCEGEYCFVVREDDGKLYEGTFITTETTSDKKITPYGSPVAYPIITLTEIQKNNDDCILRVRKATKLIQEQVLNSSKSQLHSVIDSSRRLVSVLEDLNVAYSNMHEYLKAEQNSYMSLRNVYAEKKALTPEQQSNYKKVIDKLHKIHVTFVNLSSFINKYNSAISTVNSLSLMTHDTITSMFLEAKRSYDHEISAQLLKAESWKLPAALNAIPTPQLLAGVLPPLPATEEVSSLKRVLRVPSV